LLKLALPNPNTIFWTGGGGSVIIIDMDARTTFGYAMNKMEAGPVGDPRSFRIIEALWKSLGLSSATKT
jgi:CubicO group peptidase (beta-lactamase class C family)